MSPAAPPPPPPPEASAASKARLEALHAEAEAAASPELAAAWLHEAAALLERSGAPVGEVLQAYLGSFKKAPTFEPPLDALVRIMERRGALRNLQRVLAAGSKAADSEARRRSLLVDLAAWLQDALQDAEAAGERLAEALALLPEGEPDPTLALWLEWYARRAGDDETLRRALALRQSAAPADEAALFAIEQALLSAEDGADPAEVEAVLRAGWDAERPEVRREALRQSLRLARRLELPALEADALEHLGRVAETPGEALALGWRSPSAARLLAASLRRWRLGQAEEAANLFAELQARHADEPAFAWLRLEALAAAGRLPEALPTGLQLLEQTEGAERAAAATRLASWARSVGDEETLARAIEALRPAGADSPTAAAIGLERHLSTGGPLAGARWLQETLGGEHPLAASPGLPWRIAHLLLMGGAPAAQVLSALRDALATARGPERSDLLRDALRIARQLGETASAAAWRQELLAQSPPEEERSALLLEALLDAEAEGRAAEARPPLDELLAQPWGAAWLWGHATTEGAALSAAHAALVECAGSADVSAAHLVARARGLLLEGRHEDAERLLREALGHTPDHPYALAALEALLRRQGRADELVELLREAGGDGSATALLSAAATAGRTGDVGRELELLREASAEAPERPDPWWAALLLALRLNRREAVLEALEGLAELERSEHGAARRTVELGALAAHGSPPDPETALRAWREALDGPEGELAALHLLLGGAASSADAGDAAEAALRVLARRAEASPDAEQWRRWLQTVRRPGEDEEDGAPNGSEEGPLDVAEALRRWLAACTSEGHDDDEAERWAALARATTDPDATADLLAHAARLRLAQETEGAAEEAFMLAYEASEAAPGAVQVLELLEDTTGPGDDPETRLPALEARMARAAGAHRLVASAAHGRALLAAGRAREALAALRAVVQQAPEDLGAWEALRQAAWQAEAWPLAAEAADRLAEHLRGVSRAALLEESAAVRMDHLEDLEGAEARLKEALQIAPERAVAFERLHDLLTAREDTEGLLSLVRHRLEHEPDPERLARLRYEEARLLRALGHREEALEALEALLELEPDNPGALALGVEVLTSLRRWEGVVDWLRRLAEAADVPTAQRKLARLGAADFLDKRLHRPREALEELRAAERLGPDDVRLQRRIAEVAERAEAWQLAADAHEAAAALLRGEEAAEHWEQAATLREQRLGEEEAAVQRLWRAVDAAPSSLRLAEKLARRLDDEQDRRTLAAATERSAREMLHHDPFSAEAIRLLERAAEWSGRGDLRWRCLHALVQLGAASEAERSRESRLRPSPPEPPWPSLSERARSSLREQAAADPLPWPLLGLLGEPLARAADRSPEAFGVGRSERLRGEHPWRATLNGMAAAFGVPAAAEVYLGGARPDRLALTLDRKGRPCWIVGRQVGRPPDAAGRFVIGREAWASSIGALGLLDQDAAGAAPRLAAALTACDRPVRDAPPVPRETTEALREHLGRRGIRAVQQAVASAPSFGELSRLVEAAQRSTRFAGVLASGSLQPVGRDPACWRWWLGEATGRLRKELGWVR